MARDTIKPFVLAGTLALVVALSATSDAVAGGWIDPVVIAPSGGAQPSVTMTPRGDVVVAWRADVLVFGPNTKIFRRVKPVGEGFGAATGFGDIRATEDRPATAVDAQGRPWIAFHSVTNNTIELLRGNVGDLTSFTGVATFSAAGSIGDGPQLAVGSNAAAVTYKDGNTLRLGTWSQTDGPASTELQNVTNGEPLHARVTLDDAGNVMTAWTRDPGFGLSCAVETRRRAAGAALSAIQLVGSSGVHEAPQCDDNDVDLALGPTGRVLASWYDEWWSEIRYALAAPGTGFGSATTAASATASLPSRVRGLLGTADDSLLTYLTDGPLAIHTTQRHTSGGVFATGVLDVVWATVSLARNFSDAAVGAWSGGPCPIWAAVGSVSGGLGTPTTIGSCGGNLQVAIDTAGDAAVVWDESGGTIKLDIYDNTPPELTNVSAPATATTDLPVAVSATASDALSNATIHWRFGDGEEADGTNASHVYASPGTYQVAVDATDQGGNLTTEQRTINVALPSSQDPVAGPNSAPPLDALFGVGPAIPPDGPAVALDGPTIAILRSKLVMNKKGVVRIKLACPTGTDGGCRGPVTLERGTQTASIRVLGKRSFSVKAGGRTTLKLKLSKKSRKFVLKKRRIKATLRILARDRLGRSRTTLKAVSVRAAKHK